MSGASAALLSGHTITLQHMKQGKLLLVYIPEPAGTHSGYASFPGKPHNLTDCPGPGRVEKPVPAAAALHGSRPAFHEAHFRGCELMGPFRRLEQVPIVPRGCGCALKPASDAHEAITSGRLETVRTS